MSAVALVSNDILRAHHCLEAVDRVPGDLETTAFKRRARLHQALWREARRLPIGSQPMKPSPGQPGRPLGSRLPLDAALASGANFVSDTVRKAVSWRLDHPEPHQMLDVNRLHCDLLSSMPMCFNLFGHFHSDLDLADRAAHSWWPDIPGKLSAVRFEWSPGRRLRGCYLENQSAFDVAFEFVLDDGGRGVVGVECKYHEDCRREKAPIGDRLDRYTAVAQASGILEAGALNSIWGTDLQQILLDHLLALSMLQDPEHDWRWAKFVVVHPQRNPSYARAAARYCALLADSETFEVNTVEALLEADVFPADVTAAFRERYLW